MFSVGSLKLFLLGTGDIADAPKRRAVPGRKKTEWDYPQIHAAVVEWTASRIARDADFLFEDLSLGVKVPEQGLRMYFKEYLNTEFRKWKVDLRIRECMSDLVNCEDENVNQIARRLGFKDLSNFHRTFKKIAGCTPHQWRNSGGHPEIYRKTSSQA